MTISNSLENQDNILHSLRSDYYFKTGNKKIWCHVILDLFNQFMISE